MRHTRSLLLSAMLALSAGCASQSPSSVMSTEGTTLVRRATVTNVRDVAVQGQSSGLGTAVGAVLGGIAGSAIGNGNGSTVASIGGSIAGGIAGDRAARSANTNTTTQVTVRLDNGEEQVFNVPQGESYRIGEPVKVLSSNTGARLSR